MYYEEKIINGVLCYRTTPNGEWEQFTLEALSAAYISLLALAKSNGERISELGDKLLAVRQAVK